MKISLEWLSEYVDLAEKSPEEIAKTLTDLGLEVENIEAISPLSGEVIVGRIEKAEQHPDADRLRVCQVNLGKDEPVQIVCGAPNARAGLTVCVASPGAVLPGDLKLKKSKIRGVESAGMILSYEELGLATSSEGIIELPADLALGSCVASYFKLNDFVLHLSITPNRGDCLSYIGIARELCAKWSCTLRVPSLEIPNDLAHSATLVDLKASEAKYCARFTAAKLEGYQDGSSPPWVYRRLKASGMRSISLMVDVTNYVMLEMGQPLHAYDLDRLPSEQLSVDLARENEHLETLDGLSRELSALDLVIRSGTQAVGLAGVMGGAATEVRPESRRILIESASFDPGFVRKTAKHHSLHSEASHRFERGIDAARCAQACLRAVELAKSWSSDSTMILSAFQDCRPHPEAEKNIALRPSRAKQILGLSFFESKDMIRILKNLGLVLLDQADDRTLWQIPSWRHDLQREIDLIEELARVHGFEKILPQLSFVEMQGGREEPALATLDLLREAVAGLGFSETITFPFLSQSDLDALSLSENHPYRKSLRLENALSEQENLMQTSLIPALLKAQEAARGRGQTGARLFQIARAYFRPEASGDGFHPYFAKLASCQKTWHLSELAAGEAGRAQERNMLALFVDEIWKKKSWDTAEEIASNFFHLKQVLIDLLQGFAWVDLDFKSTADFKDDLPFLHPYKSAWVYVEGVPVGYLGELHPELYLEKGFNGRKKALVAELSLDLLLGSCLRAMKEQGRPHPASSKFPSVDRDLCILVDEATANEAVCEALMTCPTSKNLRSLRLVDLYRGDKIPSGKKSLTYQLLFQSPDKTLKDEQVAGEFARLIEHLKSRVALEFR